MKEEAAVVILNIVWFSFWFYLIAFQGHSLWWFLFPVIFHWRTKSEKEDD